MTVPEKITANGVDLSGLAANIESIAGLLTTPPRRGENLQVPGRHGHLRRPNKMYGAGEIVLPMWVLGVDPVTGRVSAGKTTDEEFLDRLDELVKLFSADTIVLEHTRPDGTIRRAVCEVIERLEPGREPRSETFGRVSVALTIPDAFWSDVDETVMTFDVETMSTPSLEAFADASAPMSEVVLEFGPCANPEISQPSAEAYIAYDGIVPAGHELIVDTGIWKMLPGEGTPWTPDYTKLRHGGIRGPWFQIAPEPAGAPQLLFAHTGGGTARVTIRAKRRYLTG